MLMNDFFKLSSATLPKESVAKIRTNEIFRMKMTKKNPHDMVLRNKGIAIEIAEVAITQEKIIIFKLSGRID